MSKRRKRKRVDQNVYLAMTPFMKHVMREHGATGYPHLTVYQTLNNAIREAGFGGDVYVFDPTRMMKVNCEALDPTSSQGRAYQKMKENAHKISSRVNRLEGPPLPPGFIRPSDLQREFEIAERQMAMWGERAAELERRLTGR